MSQDIYFIVEQEEPTDVEFCYHGKIFDQSSIKFCFEHISNNSLILEVSTIPDKEHYYIFHQSYSLAEISTFEYLISNKYIDICVASEFACVNQFPELLQHLSEYENFYDVVYYSRTNKIINSKIFFKKSITNNNLDMITLMISVGIYYDTDIINLAVSSNKNDIAIYLIQNFSQKQYLFLVLHEAIIFKNIGIIQLLFDMDIDYNVEYIVGYDVSYIINKAICTRDLEVVKLIFQYVNIEQFLEREKNCPLHLRCTNLQILQFLLDLGVDVNWDKHLLYWLSLKPNNFEVVKKILEHGFEYKNSSLINYLMNNILYGNVETAKLLMELNTDIIDTHIIYSDLMISNSILSGNIDMIKFVHELGIDFSQCGTELCSLLLMETNLSVIKYIIDNFIHDEAILNDFAYKVHKYDKCDKNDKSEIMNILSLKGVDVHNFIPE
ncbi:putative ankyrin 2,3/unc44 [Cotonvirus japonicus]|uniref:Ankyrin 2,3/unc44 n=1 Tax=Cotonvirus japonicus TaxID=2811091 RepID=A0ABM7NT79_9VIRU|nr:putative ankyrin 2,3/unc44 [Cotonvirus japonicus]BCS83384.1 putative ankyrin 2,3/unc44 [Cotonvirus japonicus]